MFWLVNRETEKREKEKLADFKAFSVILFSRSLHTLGTYIGS